MTDDKTPEQENKVVNQDTAIEQEDEKVSVPVEDSANPESEPFLIDRLKVEKYFARKHAWLLVAPGCFFFFLHATSISCWISIMIALAAGWFYSRFLSPGMPRAQAEAIYYRLDGDVLCIDEGVILCKRRHIPLRNIKEVALVQGSFARASGIWNLHMTIIGDGRNGPLVKLYGLYDPETTRNVLLKLK